MNIVQEIHQLVASCMPPTGDLASNPGMCLDSEFNQRPFSLQASAQSTEPHQAGKILNFSVLFFLIRSDLVTATIIISHQVDSEPV